MFFWGGGLVGEVGFRRLIPSARDVTAVCWKVNVAGNRKLVLRGSAFGGVGECGTSRCFGEVVVSVQ